MALQSQTKTENWFILCKGEKNDEKSIDQTEIDRSRAFTAFLVRVCYCGGIIIAYSNLNRRKKE